MQGHILLCLGDILQLYSHSLDSKNTMVQEMSKDLQFIETLSPEMFKAF